MLNLRKFVLNRSLHTYAEASKSLFPTVSKFNVSYALPTLKNKGLYIFLHSSLLEAVLACNLTLLKFSACTSTGDNCR